MVVPSLKSKQSGSAPMIAVALLVLVVIGGVGVYIVTGGFRSDNNSSAHNLAGNFKITKASSEADIKAMFAAVKAGDYDVQCTLDYDKAPTTSNNILAISGKSTLYLSGAVKMRVDTTINKKPGHFMRLGNSAYIWTDGSKQGSKFPVTSTSAKASTSTDKYASSAGQYDMTCQSAAKLDDSLFILPTGVTFTDVNSTSR